MLDRHQLERFERDHDVDFAMSWEDKARLRGARSHNGGRPRSALRIIPERIPDYEELGIPVAVQVLATLPQGFVLVTGPTGSGKSTTQASMIDWINDTPPVPHPHDRGPDRIHAQAQGVPR